MRLIRGALLIAVCCVPVTAAAQAPIPPRTIEFRFTPTERTQIALWIEKPDGTFLQTIRLTQSVSVRGIGNRPGASQMNSGFRWPYGRREGVLPVWAHRRAAAPGALQFRRVIFQDRRQSNGESGEGFASRTSNDQTPDAYFCLSFNNATTQKDALDAVTCATPFSSDKGRYMTYLDVETRGGCEPATTGTMLEPYAEPAETNGQGGMRRLEYFSLYPPRRDVKRCPNDGCFDTIDVASYDADARQVMPDIDVVTMATPPPDPNEQSILFTAPDAWPDGEYVAWLEVNVEGDYNNSFNNVIFPTPEQPSGAWDVWALTYGYPYRGQPSVVFSVPFALGVSQEFGAAEPAGYGDVDGYGPNGGQLYAFMPGIINDDPVDDRGSGADRLRLTTRAPYRFSVAVRDGKECQVDAPPSLPLGVSAVASADGKHSHEWGHLHFVVPLSDAPIAHYEVRYSRDEITTADPASFERALPAMAAMIDSQALMVPTNLGTGANVDVDFGGMEPLTRYWIAVRAVDLCNVAGPYAVASLTTTRVNFTQLKGCFVATAAYGSALEPEVDALRAARDALRPRSVLFAAATDLYYRSGPAAADVIAGSDVARALVRRLLGPVIDVARATTPAHATHN